MGKKAKIKNIWKKCTSILMVLCLVASMTGVGVLLEYLFDKYVPDNNSTVMAAPAQGYIYFDNGLSGYDKVYYTLEVKEKDEFVDSDFIEMKRLDEYSAGDEHWPADTTNVNGKYVYVTDALIDANSIITFRGVDSGRVYDTMSNYQLSSASREWGYDYEDFVWTSDPLTVGLDEDGDEAWDWNCYYAAALAMQNKYKYKDGTQFITSANAARGNEDTANVTVNLIELLEASVTGIALQQDSIVIEESGNEASGVSEDSAVQTPATATDATPEDDTSASSEDVGNAVTDSETENIVNEDNGIALMALSIDGDGTFTDEETITDEAGTKYIIPQGSRYESGVLTLSAPLQIIPAASARLSVNGDNSGITVKDNTGRDALINTHLTPSAFLLDKNKSYFVGEENAVITELVAKYKIGSVSRTLSGAENGTNKTSDTVVTVDGFAFTITASSTKTVTITNGNTFNLQGAPNTEGRAIKFTVPSAGTLTLTTETAGGAGRYPQLYVLNDAGDTLVAYKASDNEASTSGDRNHTITFDSAGTYYFGSSTAGITVKNFKVTYNDSGFSIGPVYPEDGINRTFVGYAFDMGGYEDVVNDVNRNGVNMHKEGGEASYDILAASDGIPAGTDTYTATAEFYDYFSDWELSGHKLTDHQSFTFNPSNDDTTSILNPNLNTTFTENSNTISYAYQGDLWNQAISDYYKSEESAVNPLLFGSNSWFTGNQRYDTEDRNHGTWSMDEYNYRDGYQSDTLTANSSNGLHSSGIAYNIPDEREYLNNFMNGEYHYNIDNPALGMSNSRGVVDIAQDVEFPYVDSKGTVDTSDDVDDFTVKQMGSNQIMPYFNKDFLRGDNEKHAVYGKIYDDVTFRFKMNEATGYYEYDSTKSQYATRVTYNPNTKKYYMRYTGQGVTKADASNKGEGNYQFYPFNSNSVNASYAKENLMFGMKLSIPLTTYSNAGLRTSIFKFSGDDDVWVYLNKQVKDDQGNVTATKTALALDIGGTHAARGGVVDMKNQIAVAEATYDEHDAQYGMQVGGTGNSQTSSVDAKETAVFALVTNNEITTGSGNLADFGTAYWFGTSYTGSGTYITEIADGTDDNGNAKQYYKVTVNGTISDNSTTYRFSNDEFYYYYYELEDVLQAQANEDSIEFTLDVFVLERGVNSSNLKLAFKTLPITERAAEKEWTDAIQGFNDHKVSDMNHSDSDSDGNVNFDANDPNDVENVKIGLYREMVTGVEATSFAFRGAGDATFVRASVYGSSGEVADSESGFVTKDGTVKVTMNVDKDTKYLAFAMNSVLLTDEVCKSYSGYNGFIDAAGINIIINDEEIPDPSFTDEGLLDISSYVDGSQDITVTFSFNAVGSISNSNNMEKETWSMENAYAWMVECYPLSDNSLSKANLTGAGSIASLTDATGSSLTKTTTIAGETVVEEGETPETKSREVESDDMRFVIIENRNAGTGRDYYYLHKYWVYAVHKDDVFEITDNSNNNRYPYYINEAWNGIFDKSVITNTSQATALARQAALTVKSAGDTADRYFTTVVGESANPDINDDGPPNHNKLKGFGFTKETALTEDIVLKLEHIDGRDFYLNYYNNIQLYNKRYNASNAEDDPWYKHWELLADSVTINGREYPYRYFITAEVVNDRIPKFDTKYYAYADGELVKELEPIYYNYNGKDYTFYQFEPANDLSLVRIENTPAADLDLSKIWSLKQSNVSGVADKTPEEITIDIYRSTMAYGASPTGHALYKSVTFTPLPDSENYNGTYSVTVKDASGNVLKTETGIVDVDLPDEHDATGNTYKVLEWKWILEDEPLYDAAGNQYRYYAYEHPLTDPELQPTYLPSEGGVTVNGKTIYPFMSDDGTNMLYGTYNNGTFTMKIENGMPPKMFHLLIDKKDKNSGAALAGAVFELYVKEEGQSVFPSTPIAIGTTDDEGHINFDMDQLVDEFSNLQSKNKVYKLIEVSPPDGGYVLPDENEVSFSFKIDGAGMMEIDDISAGADGLYNGCNLVYDETEECFYLTVYLVNERPFVSLPESGGIGTHWFMFIGSMLVIIALMLFGYKYRMQLKKKRIEVDRD